MNQRIEWHGEEAKGHVHRRVVQFLTRAALEVKREAKRLLSVAGTATIQVESKHLTKTKLEKFVSKAGRTYRKAKRSKVVKGSEKLVKTTKRKAKKAKKAAIKGFKRNLKSVKKWFK